MSVSMRGVKWRMGWMLKPSRLCLPPRPPEGMTCYQADIDTNLVQLRATAYRVYPLNVNARLDGNWNVCRMPSGVRANPSWVQ